MANIHFRNTVIRPICSSIQTQTLQPHAVVAEYCVTSAIMLPMNYARGAKLQGLRGTMKMSYPNICLMNFEVTSDCQEKHLKTFQRELQNVQHLKILLVHH